MNDIVTQSQPPITSTTHTLPFDKLSPRDFERLCLWLVEREGYERAEHLGAAGSEQGRDIIAWREGTLWAFQCKRVQRFGPRDALAEVEKVLALPQSERPAGLVFLVTCDVSAKTRQQVRERCAGEMECHFWAGTELDEKVKRHTDIVEEFFQATGRSVIQRILGIGPDAQRARRNRRAMLELVKNFWVKGVLEQSLHGAAMIELGLEQRADAVEHPWDMVLQTPDRPNRPLPRGTKIVDVFDEMNRTLLILGEPGSGKTTMLLELARDTIVHAERDPTQPIPVVFNLSSWTDKPQTGKSRKGKKQSFSDWLVDELNTKYNIPKRIARPWVEDDDLLLLLDGLDEVKSEHREACVKAINDFRQEHGLTPLVVCSRVADYEALTTRLKLQGAVLLQPLTPQQVDQYLAGAGTELLAVRRTLQYDPTLQELAQSPLMLSVMTLVCRGMSVKDLGALDSVEARRRHMFDAYVQRMFRRRSVDQLYSPGQTTRWLAWLARKMREHAQTVLLIERMQPSWLETSTQGKLYGVVSRTVSGLIVGIATAAFIGKLNWLVDGAVIGLLLGAIAGWHFHLSSSVRARESRIELLKTVKKAASIALSTGIATGIYSGSVYGLRAQHAWGLQLSVSQRVLHGLIDGILFGLAGGIFYGLVTGRRSADSDIETVETLKWSWWALAKGLASGLLSGVVFGLAFGVMLGAIFVVYEFYARSTGQRLYYDFLDGLSAGMRIGLFAGPTFGISIMLHYGLIGSEVRTKTSHNQGTWLSLRHGVLVGLLVAICSALIFGQYADIEEGLRARRSFLPSFAPGFELLFGASSGLIGCLLLGGRAVIQHFTLRLILWRNGNIPWNYARFLDYAAERIFLRKVGGGYIFVHRLLMEYFASLDQDQWG